MRNGVFCEMLICSIMVDGDLAPPSNTFVQLVDFVLRLQDDGPSWGKSRAMKVELRRFEGVAAENGRDSEGLAVGQMHGLNHGSRRGTMMPFNAIQGIGRFLLGRLSVYVWIVKTRNA